MSDFTLGKGATLSINGQVLGLLVNVSDIGHDVSLIDVTVLADGRKKYIAGIPDGKEVQFAVRTNFGDENQTLALLALSESPITNVPVVVSGKDEGVVGEEGLEQKEYTISFDGILTSVGVSSIEQEQVWETSGSIKINSNITIVEVVVDP